jgi:hypothetical protein
MQLAAIRNQCVAWPFIEEICCAFLCELGTFGDHNLSYHRNINTGTNFYKVVNYQLTLSCRGRIA